MLRSEDAEVAALLAEGLPEELAYDPAEFPDQKDPATWPVSRVQGVLRVMARIKADAAVEIGAIDNEIERLGNLRKGKVSRRDDKVSRFEGMLQRWFETHRPTTKKSIDLGVGVLSEQKGQPALRVDDEAAVIAWAKVHCKPAVKVEESVLLKPLKAHFKATAELPPGTTPIPAGVTFKVALPGEREE